MKPFDLKERTFMFANSIIDLVLRSPSKGILQGLIREVEEIMRILGSIVSKVRRTQP